MGECESVENIFRLSCHKARNVWWRQKKAKYKSEEEKENAYPIYSQVSYYASGNAGDTVLSQCVRRTFERQQNSLGWNLISVNQAVTHEMIVDINNTQAIIIGGGGLFLPDTNANEISGWQWAINQEQLKEIQVPILVYSVGYNYFPGQEPNELFQQSLKCLCEKASFIGLRNYGSIDAVKSLLPEELAAKVTYQPCTTTLIRKIYGNKILPKAHTNKIAFNLAFDREERRYLGYRDEICTAIAKAAKEIEDRGYEIIIVAHCDGDEQILPYMKRAGVNFVTKNLSHTFPMEVYQFYNEIECVIGMRGHAQMIPFGLNCEIISLGTHDKMRWFPEDIDALDWYVDLIKEKDHLTKTIVEKFCTIHEVDAENTQLRLLKAQEKLWDITQDNIKEISGILSFSKDEKNLYHKNDDREG